MRDGGIGVIVADTGTGIAPSEMGDLLNRGVGLSNVNSRLIKLYGQSSRLRVDSAAGQGTTVSFSIPTDMATERHRDTETGRRRDRGTGRLRSQRGGVSSVMRLLLPVSVSLCLCGSVANQVINMIRTLIVDDEELARKRLRRMLAPFGDVDVVGEAENGAEAVTKIESERPDLVFLDVQMPDLTGSAR